MVIRSNRNYGYTDRLTALIILMCALAFSCKPVSQITIEILEPAEVTIPSYIQAVSFANRSYIPWLATIPSDTARRSVKDLVVIDTIISNKLFLGLIEALNASPLFDLDDPPIYQLRRADSVRFPDLLTVDQAGVICDTSQTDCLISLEGYEVIDTLFYDFLFDSDDNFEVIYLLAGTVQWRIYDDIYGTVVDDFMMNDSISWIVSCDYLQGCMDELPEAADAYREYGYQAGYKFGQRLTPEWYTARRFFYRTGNREMIKAAKMVDEGNWNEALNLWKSISESEKDIIAARASFNIALYYEMEDRLIPAIDWATQSYNQSKEDYTKQYLEILEQRKLNKLKLQQQLPMEEIP